MSRSVVYRERDTEREWDEQPRKSYTTVKRYQVPDSSSRSQIDDDTTKEKITIKRERSAQPREDDYRYSDSRYRESDRSNHGRGNDDSWDIKITERTSGNNRDTREEDDWRFSERYTERDTGPSKSNRDVSYRVVERDNYDYDDRKSVVKSDRGHSDHRSSYHTDYRYTERDRELTRAPSPPQEKTREFRFERERDWSPPERPERSRGRYDDYEVERYVKETDYYDRPQPSPQPIIIRERAAPQPAPIIIREERRDPAPIIIREERREPQYEFIERKEAEEEKALVKREEPPPPAPAAPPAPPEEDYFYERRVREIDRPRSRDHRSEIRPKDSASNYSSDDSYEYVRRERTYTDDVKDPHHKRHLAEGALAGIAGAEILRHHRQSEGKESGGRLKSAVGGALVGGLGAEVVSRARSRHRSRHGSRSRSRSSSFDSRRDRRRRRDSRSRSRSRSRSKSMSRKQLAGLAGVAAVGALAGYALKNKNKNETVIVDNGPPPRRSRSRRRRGSADSYMDRSVEEDDKHRDPQHRNKRIAEAGLASAAAAGIWERYRSKSRGGKGGKDRERSKSRIRQAIPIVGTGLGGAALAGLWEKNKANKEAKRDKEIEAEMGRGRRRRSRSRSRSRSVPDSRRSDRGNVNRDMIAYGDDPVHGDERSYYSEDEPGVYNRRRGSVGSSPDNRRGKSRSRSRGRGLAEGAAAAGLGGLAAHEWGKRKDRKKEEERQRQDDQYYDDHYGPSPGPYSPEPHGYLPPQQNAGYPSQQAYQQGPYFPPPPTGDNVYAHNEPYPNPQQQQAAAYPPYNPADYAQPGAQPAAYNQTPYGQTRGAYGDSEANLGAPHPNDTFAGDPRYAPTESPQPPHTPQPQDGRGRGRDPPPENVSAPINNDSTASIKSQQNDDEHHAQDADGMRTPRARSSSRVRFNLDANTAHSPETPKKRPEQRFSDTETSGDKKKRHRRKKHRDRGERDRGGEASRDSPQLMNDKYERAPKDDDSDDTEELPDRFDEHGNKKAESGDPLEHLLGNLASRFLGGGGNDESDSRSGRRRHRH